MGLMARFKSTATFMSLTVNSSIPIIGSGWPPQRECEDSAFVDTITPGRPLPCLSPSLLSTPGLRSSIILLFIVVDIPIIPFLSIL